MTEITGFNFTEDDFTAADLVKFELIKSEEEEDLNNLAELFNHIVAAKAAKLSQEKEEFYSKQLVLKELESDIFYNHFPCGYFSTDSNGIINKINTTLLGWLGYAKEDIIGKVTWQSLLSVGGKMYFETHYSPLLQMQGFVQEISFEMVKKDKTRLPILINTKQIRDENGKVQINYSTVFDVSQRKSYEKELLIAKRTAEDQNELIEYTFRNASIPIYYVLEDASIYDFNDIAAEKLGYTSEELHTLKIYDLDKNYDEKKWASEWAKLKAKKKITIETQQKKKDGTLIDVIITANYVKYGDLQLNCSYVLDITEKKKRADELKIANKELAFQNEEKEKRAEDLKLMDFAFKESSTPIMLHLQNGEFYSFNDALLNLLGYTKEEFSKMNLLNVVTMDELACISQWDEIKEKGTVVFDCHFERKDGVLLDVEVSSNLIKYNKYEVNFCYINDITEKKKAETEIYSMNELLQRQTDRLLLATKSAQLGIWDWDLESDTLVWDEGMCKLYGIAANKFKLIKEEWIARLHEEDRTEIDNEIQLAITNKKEYNTEFRIVWSDSSIHYIRATGIVERVDGKPKRMIGVNWDVTAEKQSIQHLKLLESVIVNSKDSIVITDAEPLDDEQRHRIIFMNPAFEKMTGYTAEELIGVNPRLLQNEDTDRKELDKLRTALNKWEPCEITISNTRKNGEKFWNNISVAPVANEKELQTHWIAIERDVTKQIEATLEKERMILELMANNSELKQFSYITTHNLRAPLTNLVLICKLINLQKIEDPSTLKLIEAFKTSTHQLNETLNDLINVLIVKENTNLTLDELSVEEIIDKVKESISESLRDSKAIIETDFSDMPTVHFAKVYLESIFLNLITNSIKYRHPERNPIVKIKTTKDAIGRTKLTFSDNGIGMDMSRVKHKIFGFHQRFHNNADSKGIGLFLIKSQIYALGGQIEVNSEVNIGTHFTITFK
jgi:PAS domain S-box-containing protein